MTTEHSASYELKTMLLSDEFAKPRHSGYLSACIDILRGGVADELIEHDGHFRSYVVETIDAYKRTAEDVLDGDVWSLLRRCIVVAREKSSGAARPHKIFVPTLLYSKIVQEHDIADANNVYFLGAKVVKNDQLVRNNEVLLVNKTKYAYMPIQYRLVIGRTGA